MTQKDDSDVTVLKRARELTHVAWAYIYHLWRGEVDIVRREGLSSIAGLMLQLVAVCRHGVQVSPRSLGEVLGAMLGSPWPDETPEQLNDRICFEKMGPELLATMKANDWDLNNIELMLGNLCESLVVPEVPMLSKDDLALLSHFTAVWAQVLHAAEEQQRKLAAA